MFGDDGWCDACGIPKHAQTGPLVLQARGLNSARGVWQPNWQFDVFCMERAIGLDLLKDFDLEFWEVGWPSGSGPALLQLEVPTVGEEWFDRDELSALLRSQHGRAGRSAPNAGCGSGCQCASGLNLPRCSAG